MDKLRVLQQLSKEENSSARIFKFVADPPTTTLQRLKVPNLREDGNIHATNGVS